jgi:hypothetical protein
MKGWMAGLGLASALSILGPSVVMAAASPPGNDNWLTLEGVCDGEPATLLDPKGGNTAFLVGGSVGVGKIFTWVNDETDEVLLQTVAGRGVDPDRLITCEFMFPDVEFPGVDGLIDVRLVVQALPTPQGG